MNQNISEITDKLNPVFDRYNISRAILFGSFAKGTATTKSDLDLLVDSHLKGFMFCGLMSAIQEAVDMPVDVLDVAHIEEDSPIDREIKQTGVLIYEK